MKGHICRTPKVMPGSNMAGKKTFGIMCPNPTISQLGMMRKRPVEPAHVPVGLHGVAHLVGHVGPVQPDRVDLEQRTQEGCGRHREEA